jgi:hypothetical protein
MVCTSNGEVNNVLNVIIFRKKETKLNVGENISLKKSKGKVSWSKHMMLTGYNRSKLNSNN